MSDSRIDELRRIAFGRGSTAEKRAAASEELRLLDEARALDELHEKQRPDVARAPVQGTAIPSEIPEPREILERPAPRSRDGVRAIWLVPIVLASLALGAIGGNLLGSGQDSRTAVSSGSQTDAAAGADTAVVGDVGAAINALDRPATDQDSYPHEELVKDLRRSSVRYLGGRAETVRLWAGRNAEDGLCLLATQGSENLGAATCATQVEFTEGGIGFGLNGYSVYWDGRDFTITPPVGG